MELGERLVVARKHAKLSQLALFKKSGVQQQNISAIETGKVTSSSFSADLARACGVDTDWLISGRGSMIPMLNSNSDSLARMGKLLGAGIRGANRADAHLSVAISAVVEAMACLDEGGVHIEAELEALHEGLLQAQSEVEAAISGLMAE